jgi:RND family efflux transporter MFP subunit
MSAPSNKSSAALRTLVVLVILAVLSGGAWYGYRALRPAAVVEPVVSGQAINAKPGSVTVTEDYPQDVKAELAGRVLEKDFNLSPGKIVRRGEVLVRLDTTDLRLAMEKDQIAYDALKATYEADHSGEIALKAAKIDLANAERLHKLGSMSDQAWDQAQRTMDLTLQGQELTKIDHKQKLATYENTIATEKHQIEKMTLTSGFDAQVKEVYAHPGELIGSGTPIARLITLHKNVVGKISDEDFADIAIGQPAVVTFIPYGNFVFNGKVSQILPTTDPDTQRHLIHLEVEIAPEKLVPGINGELSVTVNQRPAAAIVPRRAVFALDGDNVYVVKDGVVELRKVKKGYVWAKGIEIVEGLQAGEQVIVESLQEFHAGDHVTAALHPSDVLTNKL